MRQATHESNLPSSRVHAGAPSLTRRVALTLAAGTAAASAATALAVSTVFGAEPDPIFALIEQHKAAEIALGAAIQAPDEIDEQINSAIDAAMRRADAGGEIDQMQALLSQSQSITRDQTRDVIKWKVRELVREDWQSEIERAEACCQASLSAADAAAWRLVDSPPISMAGIVALLRYAHEFVEAGAVWPCSREGCDSGASEMRWESELHRSLADVLDRVGSESRQ